MSKAAHHSLQLHAAALGLDCGGTADELRARLAEYKMPPRNKRKRPTVKTEPPHSSSDDTHVWQGYAKRVKTEPEPDSGEDGIDADMGAASDEIGVEVVVELSDDEQGFVVPGSRVQLPARSVRRSAGGRAPRRGTDVRELYEEVGLGQLARSLGQVVKEEGGVAASVCHVKVEAGSWSPLRVSDGARRAAAARVEQLLSGEEGTCEDVPRDDAAVAVRNIQRLSEGKRSSRIKFTEEQRAVLRAQFDADPYPDRETKEDLSEQLGVEYKSIQRWFSAERERRGTRRSDDDSARKKCVFGSAVYDELVTQFELNPRPDLAIRKALAVMANASVTQIRMWFQNRRKSQLGPPKKVEITPALRAELEAVFKAGPYPDRETRAMLAEKFESSMEQIAQWYRCRRRRAGIKESKDDHSRRTCQFGPEGYDKLVAQFEADPYPDMKTRAVLATDLGGTVEQVSNWFCHRRASEGIASKDNEMRQKCALGPAAYGELVAAFEVDPFPCRKTREALAARAGGTLKQITSWFRGRRQKEGIPSRSDGFARSLCRFGAQVYDELVAQFEADPFPDSATVGMLAHKAGGTHQQISNWFSHRRQRCGILRSNEEGARLACKFGPEAYDQLVAQFEADPYPSADVIEGLADVAGASTAQIRTWFASCRHRKHRRQKQK